MNLTDWAYHLSLRTALQQTDFRDPHPAGRPRRQHIPTRAGHLAVAVAALLVPALLVAAALLGA